MNNQDLYERMMGDKTYPFKTDLVRKYKGKEHLIYEMANRLFDIEGSNAEMAGPSLKTPEQKALVYKVYKGTSLDRYIEVFGLNGVLQRLNSYRVNEQYIVLAKDGNIYTFDSNGYYMSKYLEMIADFCMTHSLKDVEYLNCPTLMEFIEKKMALYAAREKENERKKTVIETQNVIYALHIKSLLNTTHSVFLCRDLNEVIQKLRGYLMSKFYDEDSEKIIKEFSKTGCYVSRFVEVSCMKQALA